MEDGRQRAVDDEAGIALQAVEEECEGKGGGGGQTHCVQTSRVAAAD